MLGHVVSWDVISTDPEKGKVIREWTVPENETQLKAFLGTAFWLLLNLCKTMPTAAPLHSASHS